MHIDGRDHVALVATPVDAPDDILAVARFIRLDEDPTQAEFAIVVGDPYQQDGLGTALMERLRAAAAASGITSFKATMLAENLPAHHLVHGFARTPTIRPPSRVGRRDRGRPQRVSATADAIIAPVSWKLTVRAGPKVERTRFDSLEAALDAAEQRGRELVTTAVRPAVDVKFRQFEPIQLVAARIEVAGPERLFPSSRGGLDVRGDGSVEAYVGGVRREVVGSAATRPRTARSAARSARARARPAKAARARPGRQGASRARASDRGAGASACARGTPANADPAAPRTAASGP